MASPTPSSHLDSNLTLNRVALEDLATKIKEILGDETPDQCEGETREEANICFILGTHRRSTIFGYVYEKSKEFHAAIEQNSKNFDWFKTVNTKPHAVLLSHLKKITNPKAADLRNLVFWYTYLHGGKIGPDDTQTKGKLWRLLNSIKGRVEISTAVERAGFDIGEYLK